MEELINKEFKPFDLFKNQWALVTAGNLDDYNSCTVGWGSFGTIWTKPGKSGAILTVYLHPARYTTEFFKKYSTFTVSFYDPEYKKALGYMGSHSGRNEDKAVGAGLTPVSIGDSVTFQEAKMTFLCRKMYQGMFEKEGLSEDIQEYYKNNPKAYPVDENDDWNPHWMFVGEILEVKE